MTDATNHPQQTPEYTMDELIALVQLCKSVLLEVVAWDEEPNRFDENSHGLPVQLYARLHIVLHEPIMKAQP